jgi:hypothetical protein
MIAKLTMFTKTTGLLLRERRGLRDHRDSVVDRGCYFTVAYSDRCGAWLRHSAG